MRKALAYGRLVTLFASLIAVNSALAAPPGAIISNQASFDYVNLAGGQTTVLSNSVEVTVAVVRSPSAVEFTRVLTAGSGSYQETVGPAYCSQGGGFVLLANPTLTGGATIDPTLVQEVAPASTYNLGEPLFLRLADSDQNLDFQVIDTAIVDVVHPINGDTETIQLSETGPDTGVFAGYVPSSRAVRTTPSCGMDRYGTSTPGASPRGPII